MKELAVLLRTLQFYTHNLHNLVKGRSFFADHAFLGDIYRSAEKDYDSIIERMLGLDKSCNLVRIQAESVIRLKTLKHEFDDICFIDVLKLHQEICDWVNGCDKKQYSEGTIQLIGEIGNQCEMRIYKLKHRIGGKNGKMV